MTAIVIASNQPQRWIENHLLSILNYSGTKWYDFRDELKINQLGDQEDIGVEIRKP